MRSSEIDVGRDRHFVVLEAFISQVSIENTEDVCVCLCCMVQKEDCVLDV